MTRSHPPARFDAPGDEYHRRIVDAIHDHGWSEQDNFLPPDLTLALALECAALAAAATLTMARVGHGAAGSLQRDVRGDRIQWLKAGQSEARDRYLAIMEVLRIALNRGLFLGLEEYESHFAHYAPGASYLRHRDQFRDDDSRTVSVIVYLNADWLPEHGGALRLHPEGLSTQDISQSAAGSQCFYPPTCCTKYCLRRATACRSRDGLDAAHDLTGRPYLAAHSGR